MPPRPMLPARRPLRPARAAGRRQPEAVEIAWRALLKRHHPDVAGPHADELAKRINVAHDWLSDPELRARYDRERHPGRRRGRAARAQPGGPPLPATRGAAAGPAPAARARRGGRAPPRPRPPPLAGRARPPVARRVAADRLRRLDLALPVGRPARRRRGARATGPGRAAAGAAAGTPRPATRSSATPTRSCSARSSTRTSREPFRERVRERLARGWEAAIDQPRYGPNSDAVRAAIERLRTLGPSDLSRLVGRRGAVRRRRRASCRGRAASRPADDDALRVSSQLAQRDAAAALARPAARRSPAARSAGRCTGSSCATRSSRPSWPASSGPWSGVAPGEPAPPTRPTAQAAP